LGAKRVINVGDVFGRLTILKESLPQHYTKNTGQPYTKRVFSVLCSCGCSPEFDTQLNHLVTGKTLSCGCVRKENIDKRGLELRLTHGMAQTPTYSTYKAMLRRCTDELFDDWDRYGGDGVVVCASWLGSFENFFEDMGVRPEGCTLNRVNGSKIYSKETCEWATLSVQSYDQKMKSSNVSGRTGVHSHKGGWRACIGFQNKNVYLGFFSDKESAILARKKAEMEMYGFNKE
jgi:hypothetical protein